jgi:hypothetical protein
MVSRLLMLVAAMAIGNVCAQEAVTVDTGASPATVVASGSVADTTADAIGKPVCMALCAGSAVELEIVEPISSKRHKKGDRFALRLVTALTVGSDVHVPAGTIGTGEVIHASPSRAGGKPGELLLAARQLETSDGRRIGLRAMKLSARGKDTSTAAITTAMLIGPVAMFVHGSEIEIPAGTRAMAKLAQDVALTAPQPAAAASPDDAPQPAPHQPEVPTGIATQP